jgi:PhzF family phenazine biosynthesis protein
MPQPIVVVDAFTDRPFAGNPAAVCVMKAARDERWMQLVAREMNLSETAFLVPDGDAFHLRWFTPTVEVDLCGHATLASSHALWTEGHLPLDAVAKFRTKSGELTATRRGDWIELNFPAMPTREVREVPPGLAEALGAAVVAVRSSRLDLLVEVESERVLRDLAPDIAALKALPVRGIIVTAGADGPEFDFLSRFFAPNVGIDEDPVCGSAHCCLGPYWSEKLGGKADLLAYQASARGGVLRVGVRGDRVRLAGRAVTTLRGALVD